MSKYFIIAIFSLLPLIIGLPATAEFYQYVDGNGITHLTDNPTTIP